MLCQKCGLETTNDAHMCEHCGASLSIEKPHETGTAGIRQGRNIYSETNTGSSFQRRAQPQPSVRRYEKDAGRPADKRGVADMPSGNDTRLTRKREKTHSVQKHMINWALIGAILLALILVSLIGGYVWMNYTPPGQLIMARLGYEAPADALWLLGQEYLDQGYIERAIQTYEKAYGKDPKREDIYARLEDLAEAYEAKPDMKNAEAIYKKLYKEIDQANAAGYRNMIRIMLDQDRLFEATALMRTANEKTGDISFISQREQYVPKMPTASMSAGRYLLPRTVALYSVQDYDIFYTMGEGELPETGTLYEGPFLLEEGSYTIRAVCISSSLISDEMLIKYTITLPVPLAPKSRLAPGEYERRQNVYLYTLDEEEDVVIYYTIDSSPPTPGSPVYTGEPILLPGGRVTLRAIAVNKYGKASNELNNVYRINVGFKNYYRDEDDPFKDFSILSTTMNAFVQKAGQPLSEEEITDTAVMGSAVKLTYSWGEARFTTIDSQPVIYYLQTAGNNITGPRSTKVGMSQKDVTDKFRDMGQVASANGNRSLYYDKAVGYGRYTIVSKTEARIDYVYLRADSYVTTLTYTLTNNIVTKITVSLQQ